MVEPVLVHQGEVRIVGRGVGSLLVAEHFAEILPDKKRAACNNGTLVLYRYRKPLDMIVAKMTDHENPGRGIPYHFPVPAPRDPVDRKEREYVVFGTEFAVPLNGDLEFPL